MRDREEIQAALTGKPIFLLPYCHADHAWEHTRGRHRRRYPAGFDRVLELLRNCQDFRFFFDRL